MADIRKFNDSKGFVRSEMPQIHKSKVDDFVKWLAKNYNVRMTIGTTKLNVLMPTQGEYNFDKVQTKINEGRKKIVKTFIADRYGYILDGHHTFEALRIIDKAGEVNTVTIDLPIEEIINLAFKYEHTYQKDLNDKVL